MKQLPLNFYSFPDLAKTTMDRADLKELLLVTEGWVLINGRMRDIKSTHLGAGVYRVTLAIQKEKE